MDDLRPRLAVALAGTHDIERELGGGGMSRTYVAVERNFRRRVVLKVLAPELTAGLSVERFHREILLAAQLQHPHIVPVLTAGEADGLPWFTMPYVDGESLRKRLDEGALPIAEAVSILRDVARALAYAHGQGVVHRDIKPDNVLLSSGTATVTDFGIAKALTAARTDSGAQGATITIAGTSLGTPAYMSPEQVTGDTDTDHRADIYSFGAMAYELLAGRAPFQGPTASKVLAAHMTETPADVRTLRPDTPPQLAALVMHCLEKDPGDRPAEAAALVRVLDSVTTSGTLPQVPSILIGGRVRLGRAVAMWAAATATVAVTAWAATDVIGLPDWVLPGSVGVMLAGLPVILMTAYVQRIAHRAFTATPQRTPGGRGAPQAHGTLATLALKASPHVSWRRTWLGGTVAVVGFGVLVLGFMVTRALGIGPAASLQGAGEFGAQETLVIADFRSPPGDSMLGATVAEALRTDLAQSDALRVLTRTDIREVLTLMRRPAESQVPFALAREIATREGAKAVLDGEVVQLGASYVISARLVASLDGRELASFRETADSENDLIGALGRVSRDVRERAGESLRTIRASSDLERVTTPSIAALRKYVEGLRVADELGDTERGLELLEEAVQLDTAFAMAWRKIGVLVANEGRDRPRALAAASTAFRHRARLTERERLLTEGYYYMSGPEPSFERARTAYEEALALDSLNTNALHNLGSLLIGRGEYERSEELYRRTAGLSRTSANTYMNLLTTQIMNRRPAASLDSSLAAYRARFPDNAAYWLAEFRVAYGRGDFARADSISRAAYEERRGGGHEILAAEGAALVATQEGRWRDAVQWGVRSGAALLRVDPSPASRFMVSFDSAWNTALARRDPAQARALIGRAMATRRLDSIAPPDRPWMLLSELAASTGDASLARASLAGFDRDLAAITTDASLIRPVVAARVALTEERWQDAIELLHAAQRGGAFLPVEILPEIGSAYDHLGRTDSAAHYYEQALAAPDPVGWASARSAVPTHRRLGELYEGAGQPRKAIEHYARFVERWKDADPELQVQVEEVRERLGRLREGLETAR